MPAPSHGRHLIYGLIALSSSFLVFTTFRLISHDQWQPFTSHLEQYPQPQDPFNLLPGYDLTVQEHPGCAERFGRKYLDDLRRNATEYCEPDSGSRLTCFHSQTARDGRIDSFCFGGPAMLDFSLKKFRLDCSLRKMSANESAPRLHQLPSYWYGTGPSAVFSQSIKVNNLGFSPPKDTKNYTILVKREGEGNPWHSLLEIFSMSLTIDALKIDSGDGRYKPFLTNEDAKNTQVVILDRRKNGPYFHLWSLFAERPTIRLANISHDALLSENVIVPLAGGSNPLWQGDWEVFPCQRSDLLRVFSNRVLDHYQVDRSKPREEQIVVTFIDRKSRRLTHQESYLEALSKNMSQIKVQSIDFAAIPFKEQLKVARATDVLVGVHGAGLTHSMFLREGSVVVEILPRDFNHKGFLNVANLLGHSHFSVHASNQNPQPSHLRRDKWHREDVFLEESRFQELMNVAIKTLYGQIPHHHDVN
ncbi:hypothetical protein FQN57_003969 [Myotisia sp. PD_48]|nr:hypothetical protein FQN57_003969 [Myotisia sp. PD_48]